MIGLNRNLEREEKIRKISVLVFNSFIDFQNKQFIFTYNKIDY